MDLNHYKPMIAPLLMAGFIIAVLLVMSRFADPYAVNIDSFLANPPANNANVRIEGMIANIRSEKDAFFAELCENSACIDIQFSEQMRARIADNSRVIVTGNYQNGRVFVTKLLKSCHRNE